MAHMVTVSTKNSRIGWPSLGFNAAMLVSRESCPDPLKDPKNGTPNSPLVSPM